MYVCVCVRVCSPSRAKQRAGNILGLQPCRSARAGLDRERERESEAHTLASQPRVARRGKMRRNESLFCFCFSYSAFLRSCIIYHLLSDRRNERERYEADRRTMKGEEANKGYN